MGIQQEKEREKKNNTKKTKQPKLKKNNNLSHNLPKNKTKKTRPQRPAQIIPPPQPKKNNLTQVLDPPPHFPNTAIPFTDFNPQAALAGSFRDQRAATNISIIIEKEDKVDHKRTQTSM